MVYELWNHAHFDCQVISFSGIYGTPYNIFKKKIKNWNSLKKIIKNWQILVSFWWKYSACYPPTVLLVRVIWSPKKNLRQRKYWNITTSAAFFSFWEKMILSTQICCEWHDSWRKSHCRQIEPWSDTLSLYTKTSNLSLISICLLLILQSINNLNI